MKFPAKVLIHVHALAGGGAERVCAVLANGFAGRGCEVILAVDFAASANLHLIGPGVRFVVLGRSHVVSVFRLAALLRRERPDVSFSALSVSNLKHFCAALLAGRLSRAILSYHGYAQSEPQLLSRIGYALTPLITRATAATVCVSQGLRDHVVNRWRADPRRTHVIYNPVQTQGENAQSVEALMQRGPVVLAAGRFVGYKNFPLLLRAFARVQPEDARLLILGEGPERPRIEREIARLGLGARARIVGYVAEPWRYYAQARCFALSSDSESFGLVVVEAMANGAAVVATDCEGPREILRDGAFGRLVPTGDERTLAAAITAALADPGDPRPRIARARDFSPQVGIDNYVALFARILARQPQSPAHQSSLPGNASPVNAVQKRPR
jgi:glycosyltransferase involved in cell wall biosynthesis